MDKVKVQIKDISGNWITVQTVINQDPAIQSSVNSVQKAYKKDVRAIDKNNVIVQMYPYIKT